MSVKIKWVETHQKSFSDKKLRDLAFKVSESEHCPYEYFMSHFEEVFDSDMKHMSDDESSRIIQKMIQAIKPYTDAKWANYLMLDQVKKGSYISVEPDETDPRYIYMMCSDPSTEKHELLLMTNIGTPVFVSNFKQRTYIVPDETMEKLKQKAKKHGTAW